jgi:hypothetical protein
MICYIYPLPKSHFFRSSNYYSYLKKWVIIHFHLLVQKLNTIVFQNLLNLISKDDTIVSSIWLLAMPLTIFIRFCLLSCRDCMISQEFDLSSPHQLVRYHFDFLDVKWVFLILFVTLVTFISLPIGLLASLGFFLMQWSTMIFPF